MANKNNADFSPLFGGAKGDKSGLRVSVGKDGRLVAERVAVLEDEPDPLSPDEIEALRAEAFEEGVTQGTQTALDAHHLAVEQALDRIADAIGGMIETMDRTLEQSRREAAHMAVTIASKLAPALIAREPEAEITALVDQCLATVKTEPQIRVTVAPELVEPLRAPLDERALRRGFTGRLVLAEDNGLTGADVRIEWTGGGADRDFGQVTAAIEDLIARHVGMNTDAAPAGHA